LDSIIKGFESTGIDISLYASMFVGRMCRRAPQL